MKGFDEHLENYGNPETDSAPGDKFGDWYAPYREFDPECEEYYEENEDADFDVEDYDEQRFRESGEAESKYDESLAEYISERGSCE